MASSDVIMQVVKHLNDEPFKKDLSLVAFDDMAPQELLQLLNDVISHLDESHKKDIRAEGKQATAARLARMLQTLRFSIPSHIGAGSSGGGGAGGGQLEAFQEKLGDGAKDAVYPALHYLLSKREILKKRAYIAKFLSRIELPPEFMHDEQVQEQREVLQNLQQEFKTAHKAVEQLRSRSRDPAELRRDKQQLETERSQLRDRITQQARSTADAPGFKALLTATTAMRHEQEEEGKLQERMHAQRQQLAVADQRYMEATRRLAETRANTREDASADRLLDIARSEAQEGRRLLQQGLPAALVSRREALHELQTKLREAPKSDADVQAMQAAVSESEVQVRRMSAEVAEAQQRAGQSSLVVSRQQGALVASRLADKEEALEVLRQRAEEARRAVDSREAVLQQMSGPSYMRREDFQKYRQSLLAKSQQVKRSKTELARLQSETVVLARTEQLLKSRASGVDDLMKRLEERRGVAGYTGVQASLEELSKQKAAVDATKGKTLEEISRIVTDISQSLAVRKEKLAPQIEDLRAVRMEYSELEARYVGSKRRFDSTRAGLAAQRAELERLCDQLQQDLVEREREAELLRMRSALLGEQQRRAEQEGEFEAGEGRLLRDFGTWKELFQHKTTQLESMSKSMRARQRDINENSGAMQREKQSFQDVEKLLQWKLEAYRSGALGKDDEDGAGGVPGAAGGTQVDGANVITIE